MGRCVLNVFPISTNQTIVVFSHTKPDTRPAWRELKPIMKAKEDGQKLELSKMIIRYVENFVLSPTFFDGWSAEKKEKIKGTFVATIFDASAIKDDDDLMLF